MSSRRQLHRALATTSALLLLGWTTAACGSDGNSDAADRSTAAAAEQTTTTALDGCDIRGDQSAAPATTSIQVSLTEYAITATPATAPAGPVEFVAANDGRIWHELMVVRYDGDPAGLPLDPYGGADETQLAGDALVGKILQFLAGTSCSAMFDLTPGRYALLCNLVDDGSNPHYSQGMYTSFTVT